MKKPQTNYAYTRKLQVVMNVNRHKLKYYPFPREKNKREYVIGEALLRDKRIPKDELATLQSVPDDPPDLVFKTKDCGQLAIEVTEAVPHDRASVVQANKFIKKLRNHLKGLGTKPQRRLNISVNRTGFSMPNLKAKEIEHIAQQIDDYCRKGNFPEVDTKIQEVGHLKVTLSTISPSASHEIEIGDPPVLISVIPATDAFDYPARWYQNNLHFSDSTGFPIDYREIKKCIDERIKNKGNSNYPADILIIYAVLGMLGFQGISEEIKNNLLRNLSFSGIYILQITHGKNEYIVNVTTVKEHPKFEVKN